MEQKTNYKLDIFATLEQINQKNRYFYNDLTDDERTGFAPLTVMRWLSGTNAPLQIILLNEVVNPFVFSLNKHKELLYKLMTISVVHPQKYRWLKPPSSKQEQYKHTIDVICLYYQYSIKQAKQVLPLLSNQDIIEMAEFLGLQKQQIVKLKNELKAR